MLYLTVGKSSKTRHLLGQTYNMRLSIFKRSDHANRVHEYFTSPFRNKKRWWLTFLRSFCNTEPTSQHDKNWNRLSSEWCVSNKKRALIAVSPPRQIVDLGGLGCSGQLPPAVFARLAEFSLRLLYLHASNNAATVRARPAAVNVRGHRIHPGCSGGFRYCSVLEKNFACLLCGCGRPTVARFCNFRIRLEELLPIRITPHCAVLNTSACYPYALRVVLAWLLFPLIKNTQMSFSACDP